MISLIQHLSQFIGRNSLAQIVLIKTTNHKSGECVVCSACKQNLPLTDHTEINKPVETNISICSFQLKHALFIAVEPLPEYKTESFVNAVTAPNLR